MWEWVKDLTSDSPRRDPGYLIALIEWLPSAGAFAACVQDAAPAGQGGEAKGPHRFYERGILWSLLADHWDLLAAVNAGKKKAPVYPRPGAKQKSRGMSLFSMRPKKQ